MTNDAPQLARLFRYVDQSELPTYDTVAHLDKKNNLVRINKDLFQHLSEYQKKLVWRMEDALIEAHHLGWNY